MKAFVATFFVLALVAMASSALADAQIINQDGRLRTFTVQCGSSRPIGYNLPANGKIAIKSVMINASENGCQVRLQDGNSMTLKDGQVLHIDGNTLVPAR